MPESLHRRLREIAEKEEISMNPFVATAVAETMCALLTEEYLQARAGRGNRESYQAALNEVPDVDPEERDRMYHHGPVGLTPEARRPYFRPAAPPQTLAARYNLRTFPFTREPSRGRRCRIGLSLLRFPVEGIVARRD